jgi:hypothetical protein
VAAVVVAAASGVVVGATLGATVETVRVGVGAAACGSTTLAAGLVAGGVDRGAAGGGVGGVTEDGAGSAGAAGRGLGGSFFETYSWAARVATSRNRTRRKASPSTTARARREKKPQTASPKNPRNPAPMPGNTGISGLYMVTPLVRRRSATARESNRPQ